jgi:hypothetical protein
MTGSRVYQTLLPWLPFLSSEASCLCSHYRHRKREVNKNSGKIRRRQGEPQRAGAEADSAPYILAQIRERQRAGEAGAQRRSSRAGEQKARILALCKYCAKLFLFTKIYTSVNLLLPQNERKTFF